MKQLVLSFIEILAWPWRLLPRRVTHALAMFIFLLESRSGPPAKGLQRLLQLKDRLNLAINERAMGYGKGEHPKHRLTAYHRFFIERLRSEERVLDVGCGYGAVARSVALALPSVHVTGIEIDNERFAQAQSGNCPANLRFIHGDALKALPDGPFDVVILSNILEHVHARVEFLKQLAHATGCQRMLIRVPLFERDWEMGLRKELEINYFSDDDHKIEHTLAELRDELRQAGLEAEETLTVWGEIWTACRVVAGVRAGVNA